MKRKTNRSPKILRLFSKILTNCNLPGGMIDLVHLNTFWELYDHDEIGNWCGLVVKESKTTPNTAHHCSVLPPPSPPLLGGGFCNQNLMKFQLVPVECQRSKNGLKYQLKEYFSKRIPTLLDSHLVRYFLNFIAKPKGKFSTFTQQCTSKKVQWSKLLHRPTCN